jgi:hypothetical protein
VDGKLDITDELLVAYVDDELDEPQRAMVRSVLDTSPALCRRAEDMRLSRDLLREAFPLQPAANIPASLDAAARRLAEACAAPAADAAAEHQHASRRASSFGFQNGRKYALAAAIVLSVTAAAGYLGWRAGSDAGREPVTGLLRIGPDTKLLSVLETAPSAEVINVPAERAAVRAILTFRAKDGRFCREFEILSRAQGSEGIACRDHGEWRAEVLLGSAAAPPDSNLYTPAGGSDEPAVAEVTERLIHGDPLSKEEEASLLASGWRTSQNP